VVTEPDDYALQNVESGVWLDPDSSLAECGLSYMQVLVFQKKPTNIVFGVDPSTLSMINYGNDLRIPHVLVSMKDSLNSIRGFSKPGIFRLSGDRNRQKKTETKTKYETYAYGVS